VRFVVFSPVETALSVESTGVTRKTKKSKSTIEDLADFLRNWHYDRHLRKIRTAFKNQVSCTIQAIGRSFPEGTKLSAPPGGYILWVELDGRIDGIELFKLAWEKRICIMPGAITTNSNGSKNCIRISCGHPFTERSEQGIQTLGRIIAGMMKY